MVLIFNTSNVINQPYYLCFEILIINNFNTSNVINQHLGDFKRSEVEEISIHQMLLINQYKIHILNIHPINILPIL